MDLSTLILANVVLSSIFATSFLALSFRVQSSGHWRSWAAANACFAVSLAALAVATRHYSPLLAYLVPDTLLLLALGFHWHAARQLADQPSRISNVLAPATAYVLASLIAYQTSNFALAYTASTVIFTLLCIATIGTYTAPTFKGMISAVGLILAFFLFTADGLLRIVHGFIAGAPTDPGMVVTHSILDVHLLCALIFVSLTGAFSLSISFEQIAQRHREAARRDPLTGTFNRREFQRRLEELLDSTDKEDFGLVHFDLDHFKSVNDRFGHSAGDDALVSVCRTVRRHLREDDCFARLGGEEFAVILPSISRENAFKVADRLRERIAELRFGFAPDDFRITTSSGIYHGDGDGMLSKDLIHIVDQSLYQSKHDGRNRISIASPVHTIELTSDWSNARA